MSSETFEIILHKKGTTFIDNSGIKEFYLRNRKLHLNKKGNSAFAKKLIASYK